MEQWQIEAIENLLETKVNEVEQGQRVYTSSGTYGNSRYHLIDKRYDGVQVEQVDIDEKWSKRVNFYTDEIPAVLKAWLTWYLEEIRQKEQQPADDFLGDMDDSQPF
jgi:hypothetical protein